MLKKGTEVQMFASELSKTDIVDEASATVKARFAIEAVAPRDLAAQGETDWRKYVGGASDSELVIAVGQSFQLRAENPIVTRSRVDRETGETVHASWAFGTIV